MMKNSGGRMILLLITSVFVLSAALHVFAVSDMTETDLAMKIETGLFAGFEDNSKVQVCLFLESPDTTNRLELIYYAQEVAEEFKIAKEDLVIAYVRYDVPLIGWDWYPPVREPYIIVRATEEDVWKYAAEDKVLAIYSFPRDDWTEGPEGGFYYPPYWWPDTGETAAPTETQPPENILTPEMKIWPDFSEEFAKSSKVQVELLLKTPAVKDKESILEYCRDTAQELGIAEENMYVHVYIDLLPDGAFWWYRPIREPYITTYAEEADIQKFAENDKVLVVYVPHFRVDATGYRDYPPEWLLEPDETEMPTPSPTPTPSAVPTPSDSPQPTESPKPEITGDVNGDGIVNAEDALIVLKVSAKLITFWDENQWPAIADMNHDNRITAEDALLILKAAAKL